VTPKLLKKRGLVKRLKGFSLGNEAGFTYLRVLFLKDKIYCKDQENETDKVVKPEHL
jgi:hypothetical protein